MAGDELFLLVEKRTGYCVRQLFWSSEAVEEHIKGLGVGAADNAAIRARLKVRRFVAAESLEEA